ncbi:hypothetical protein [Streptomyces sp. I6]|uniref:hypothetical protein n=1 Tax=Streptomyces sp. I6 TaxID=2483113 RepID=UPI001609C944|nr:hypothetical protein [Streptomyces sp. I6]
MPSPPGRSPPSPGRPTAQSRRAVTRGHSPSPSAPAVPGGTRTPGADRPGAGQGDASAAPQDGRTEDTGSGDWYGKTVQACRDYRNGTLDVERKRTLEAAAQGADRVKRFCDRMLTADGGGDDDGDGGGEGDDDGGQGDDDGQDGDDGDDGFGSGGLPRPPFLPPASVRPAPAGQPFVPPTDVWRVSGPAVPAMSLAAL